MQIWNHHGVRPQLRPAGLLAVLALAACLVASATPVRAQPPATGGGQASSTAAATQSGVTSAVTEDLPYTNQYWGEYFTSDLTEVFRLKHIEGDGQGDVPAFTSFGFTKFAWVSDGVVLFDLSGRITNEADPGFSLGIHRRLLLDDLLLGGGGFYDWQNDFQQASVAFELFTTNWTFRTNGYFVVGDDVETDSDYQTTGATTVFFQGNNILADNLLLIEEHEVALSGVDFEVARHLGRASEVFLGGYVLDGDYDQNTVGGKGGVRGFLVPDIAAAVTLSSDDLFGTNVYGGLTWFVGARGGLSRPNMARRIIMPVERNEQVAVAEVNTSTFVAGPIVLTHDDDPIEVVHVQAGAGGANEGTFEDPYGALPATEDADIVYVHADGIFAGQSYTVAEDQRFLGEGAGNLHVVDTDELDEIVLPAGSGGANRPIIQNATGNAIVLGSADTEVSNFEIQNPAANGIFGDGVTDFNINRNVITGAAGRGIFLNNISGEPDGEPFAEGEISNNVVTNSTLQNIQLVLASDFEGDIEGNTANGSTASSGIDISGPFLFRGEVEGNTANNNFLEGIVVDAAQFDGDIENNTANANLADGMLLTFGIFDGDVSGNTASGNGDNGVDLNIVGNFFSDADVVGNTADNNATEGIHLLFAGTGTSAVQVLNNNLSGNNGGADREFLAEVEDVLGNDPTAYIELDGNVSTNALGAGPPFNYEFENAGLFGDGEIILDLGTNVGTVELDPEIDFGEFPFDV
jgi:hypothetical protein